MRGFHGMTIRFHDPGWGHGDRPGSIRSTAGSAGLSAVPTRQGSCWRARTTTHVNGGAFREITPDSFRWASEASVDGGTIWRPLEVMTLRRRRSMCAILACEDVLGFRASEWDRSSNPPRSRSPARSSAREQPCRSSFGSPGTANQPRRPTRLPSGSWSSASLEPSRPAMCTASSPC